MHNDPVQQKWQKVLAEGEAQFPERSREIEGLALSFLSRQHCLLIGEAGTGKSALARFFAKAVQASYFERLLTKFTTPEELFGPISLKALENDVFMRVVTKKLPEAQVAFLDEIFKSSSAILNSLLTLINERLYHNDGQILNVPLISLIGASNELPEGKELEALFDRFLLRYEVKYILRASNMRAMLTAPDPTGPATRIDATELAYSQSEAGRVVVTPDTVDALITVRDNLKAEGIVASDRRWKQSLRLIQSSAWLDGGDRTCPEDLTLLADALWREPKDRSTIQKVLGKVADPASAQATEIGDAARELLQKTGEKKADPATYAGECAKALTKMKECLKKLRKLKGTAGRRATKTIEEAEREIGGYQQDLVRIVTESYGIAGLTENLPTSAPKVGEPPF